LRNEMELDVIIVKDKMNETNEKRVTFVF
jgi:hypothetical protein